MTSAAYAGDRIAKYKPLEFECGVRDLKRVLGQYSTLLNLEEVYAPYLDSGREPPAELMPKALKVKIAEPLNSRSYSTVASTRKLLYKNHNHSSSSSSSSNKTLTTTRET